MILFNGTEETLTGKCEGNPVVIAAGEVYDCPNHFHGELLLSQFGPRGLVPVPLEALTKGKPSDDIIEAARDAYLAFIEKQFQEFNDVQTGRNKQGLPGVMASKQLHHLGHIYRTLKGRDLAIEDATTKPDDQTQNIAQALISALKQISGSEQTQENILAIASGKPAGGGASRSRAAGAAAKARGTQESKE